MIAGFNAVGSKYFDDFSLTVRVPVDFGVRTYSVGLTSVKRQKRDLVQSRDWWTAKFLNTWKMINCLEFIKEFEGIVKLKYSIEELMAMILSITDF